MCVAMKRCPMARSSSVLALLQRAGFKNAGLPVDAEDRRHNRILEAGRLTGEMRLSAFFSLAAHVGAVVAGVMSHGGNRSQARDRATPMIVIPLELMTIGDVTDIAPVTEDART